MHKYVIRFGKYIVRNVLNMSWLCLNITWRSWICKSWSSGMCLLNFSCPTDELPAPGFRQVGCVKGCNTYKHITVHILIDDYLGIILLNYAKKRWVTWFQCFSLVYNALSFSRVFTTFFFINSMCFLCKIYLNYYCIWFYLKLICRF